MPSLTALLLRALTGLKFGTKHSEDPHVVNSYYPAEGGIGTIADKLAEHVRKENGKIELNSCIDAITTSGSVGNVKYSVKGGRKDIEFDYLINTIPLDSFFSYLVRPAGDRYMPDTASLLYRGTIFLYFSVSRSRITDHPWIYFNEPNNKDLIFNRMYDVANFASVQMDAENDIICLEITCYKDDSIWQKTDKELLDLCISFLEKKNFLHKNDVREYFTKRIDAAYPVFRKGYLKSLNNALDYIKGLGNVFTIGRQGLFSYTNMDHCIDMGLRMRKLVVNGGLDSSSVPEVYNDYIG